MSNLDTDSWNAALKSVLDYVRKMPEKSVESIHSPYDIRCVEKEQLIEEIENLMKEDGGGS